MGPSYELGLHGQYLLSLDEKTCVWICSMMVDLTFAPEWNKINANLEAGSSKSSQVNPNALLVLPYGLPPFKAHHTPSFDA
jgi:hypothetical protein